MKLAGARFNPEKYAPSRSTFHYDEISMFCLKSGESWVVGGLEDAKILAPHWAPDGRTLVFLVESEDGLRLWKLEAGAREAALLSPRRINGVLPGLLFRWESDGRSLLTRLVLEDEKPDEKRLPKGPAVQETSGEKAPVRTYQDLLRDELDGETFEHYASSQLARVDLNGEVTELGEPGIVYYFQSSPDRRYLLRRVIEKPYSYLVPYSKFAGRYDILTSEGELLKEIVRFPASEDLPKGFDSVRTGPRNLLWRADTDATLVWSEATDGGDMKKEQTYHDEVKALASPFEGGAESLFSLEMRFNGVDWGHSELALVSEWRYSDRRTRTWKFDPSDPSKSFVLFEDRSYNDHYGDPGNPLHLWSERGTRVLATVDSGQTLLLAGRGASPDGCIPFLDRWNAETGESHRVWSSQEPYYERVVGLLDPEGDEVITLRESVDEPPNFFRRSIASGTSEPLTDLPHPTPEFKGLKKELITYMREDGVELSGTLYLPPDFNGEPVPVLLWAYPLEYKDSTVAGQVTTSPYEFNRVSYWGPLPFLALGYAVLDDPKMPIVGEGEKLPNDSFLEQLVSSAQAAVDTLVERGIGDRERVAIGGHSYGAFMVANLLAHSDLFKTGIARSGAYNRTLTPFGFQGEERDFWEGKEVYSEMSPFFHAEKIKRPILFIHGSEDNNAGTYPMQSERMFAAIKGLGGRARLVMLPKESHAYRARESLLHMLWEQQEWLKKYL